MSVVKFLTDDDWQKIKTRYEGGEAALSIAPDFNLSKSTLSAVIKEKGWQKFTISSDPIATKIGEEIQEKIEQEIVEQVQKNYLPQDLAEDIELVAKLRKGTTNVAYNVAVAQNRIITSMMHKHANGEIDEMQCAKILAQLGANLSTIGNMAGLINKDKQQMNVQLNNGSQSDKVVVNITPVG